MPDITMCRDFLCKDRHNCYRYRAYPNSSYQSHFIGTPRKEGKCLHHMCISERDTLRGVNKVDTINEQLESKYVEEDKEEEGRGSGIS